MNLLSDSKITPPSLVAALRRDLSGSAWASFVDRYAPAIFKWVRTLGLQDSDAADVTQEVMLKLLNCIREFDPSKGKFRGWLKTVASNAARDWVRSRTRYETLLANVEIEMVQWDEVGEVIDDEYQKELLEQAEIVVRERADAQNWNVYEMLVKQGLSAAHVASDLGVTVGQVYMAKSRILRRLRKTVAELMELDE